MNLEKVITLASRKVKTPFLVLERSLRQAGCDLPLLVIPYGDDRFDLPSNAEWWDSPGFVSWLRQQKAHPMMAKYRCLTEANYVYFDTDICVLEDFRPILAPYSNFVVADTEWSRPGWATPPEAIAILSQKSSLWMLSLFNAGHFACDRVLYSEAELQSASEKYRQPCIEFPHHDQPGMNVLVSISNVEITNLCLPPYRMESTMAPDYRGDWENVWRKGHRPYFMHYAGSSLTPDIPISRLYYDFMTKAERAEWTAMEEEKKNAKRWLQEWPLPVRMLNQIVRTVDKRFCVQPTPGFWQNA
jgi:hypothetical protein